MKCFCLRQALLVATFVLSGLLLMPGPGRGADGVGDASSATPLRSGGLVTFLTAAGEPIISIAVEIPQDRAARLRGLMHRRHLPEGMGMLFMYDREQQRSFWMKNTYIPLDMIFIDSSGEIVGIAEKTQPLSEQSYPSQVPARYVVEVNAGFCATHGVKIGGRVDFL